MKYIKKKLGWYTIILLFHVTDNNNKKDRNKKLRPNKNNCVVFYFHVSSSSESDISCSISRLASSNAFSSSVSKLLTTGCWLYSDQYEVFLSCYRFCPLFLLLKAGKLFSPEPGAQSFKDQSRTNTFSRV